MAQKKRKHGKVEARKFKPLIRFKLGVLLLLIAIAFGGCFTLYLISATSQPDYWEKEIMANSQQEEEESEEEGIPVETKSGEPSAAVNPVPESERADDVHMQLCVWIGDVTELTTYYQTASEMVFPDAVSGMSESEMRNIAKKTADKKPMAIYLWLNTPAEMTDTSDFMEVLQEKNPDTPIYILSALPAKEGPEQKQAVNEWNRQLFSLADRKGLHYVDVSTALKGNDGFLASQFQENDVLCQAVGECILTHIAH